MLTSDDLIAPFTKHLQGRGLERFAYSGPFVWDTLAIMPPITVRVFVAYSPEVTDTYTIRLSTVTGTIACRVQHIDDALMPSVDERHLPSVEWLLVDWLCAEQAHRLHTIGALRKALLKLPEQEFSQELFLALAEQRLEHTPSKQLAGLLKRLERRARSRYAKVADEGGPQVASDPLEQLNGFPSQHHDLRALQPLGIPCDRHGRALRPIAKEEAYELIRRYQEHGDIKARDTLMLSNEGLARRFVHDRVVRFTDAKRITHRQEKYHDSLQEAFLGLARCVDLFDTGRGFAFSTYAMHWMRAKTGRFVANETLEESAPLPGNPDGMANVTKFERRQHHSLQQPATETSMYSEGSLELGEVIEDEALVSAEHQFTERQTRAHLAEVMQEVLEDLDDPRYRIIVERRILADLPETLEQIGQRLQMSRERVRQLEFLFVSELKKRMHLRF